MYNITNFPFLYLCRYTVLLYSLDMYLIKYYYMYTIKYFKGGIPLHPIIYCKSHRRRPIVLGTPLFRQDTQGGIPLAWCGVCGSEVFDPGQTLCIRCRNTKGAN